MNGMLQLLAVEALVIASLLREPSSPFS